MKTIKCTFPTNLLHSLAIISFCMIAFSCVSNTNDLNESLNIEFTSDNSKYDENNYSFNTINLWGSEAAVLDLGDSYIFQGDIVLSKKDIYAIATRGTARIDKRWPDNTVYYTFDGYPDEYKEAAYSAISEIEENSYLSFVPRLEGESNYIKIVFKNTDEWVAESNYIGMKGGEQQIRISKPAATKGVIMHELCHALGLYHEMCRSDRDKYIKVNFDVMNDDERYQFKTYKELGQSGADVGLFDFGSIMMYSSEGNNKLLMTKLDGSKFYAQRYELSSGDKSALAKAQPAVRYTFYSTYVNNGNIDSDYTYQRVKYLRCPEGANINFKFQQNFSPSNAVWQGYSLNDFEIKTSIIIVEKNTNNIVYTKEIPVVETSGYEDSFLSVNLPQGVYTTMLRLTGTVKGQSTSSKQSVLKKLMYNPRIYLHLNTILINNISVKIPSDFGYPADLRSNTFIQI